MAADPFFPEFPIHMKRMYPDASVPPPPSPPPSFIDNIPSIIVIFIIITLAFLSLNHIVNKFFCCLLDDSHDPLVESLDIFDRIMYMLRRGQRQQALEKLLPLVNYTRQEIASSWDCVICLENFVDGESCTAFPVCKHIFHLNCIDHWLKNHLTCPVCRNSITDAESELQYLFV